MKEQTTNNPAKVWFLYVVDHHEGPYSADEILKKVKKGEALQTSYVWKDPMQEWAIMENEPEFKFQQKSPSTTSGTIIPTGSAAAALGFKNSQVKSSSKKFSLPSLSFNFSMGKFVSLLLLLLIIYQMLATGLLNPALELAGLKEKVNAFGLPPIPIPSKDFRKILRPTLSKFADQIPAPLKPYLIGVELPQDTPEKDTEALIEAASGSLDESARIALTMPEGSAAAPSFIIATNLPDGTKLDVDLRGKSGRILGATKFESKATALVQSNIARSAKFNLDGRKSLPTGEYTVLVYESDNQSPEVSLAIAAIPRKATPNIIPSGKTAFAIESYFLGGIKDAAFESRLKEYNEKINSRINAEVNELGQILTTIESMANESATRFFGLTNKKSSKKELKSWNDYSGLYAKMSAQIQALITAKPKPSETEGIPDRFFPDLYLKAATVYDLSEQLHLAEKNYFIGKSRMDDVRDLASKTLGALNGFREQLNQQANQTKK